MMEGRQAMHRVTLILCLATFLGDCASAPPPRTARMTELGVEQTTAEMRVLLHEYLRWFTAEIVTAADGVLETEQDLAAQEAAVRLKANGMTSMQAGLFQRDPLAAPSDAWALTAAMAGFFDEGTGGSFSEDPSPWWSRRSTGSRSRSMGSRRLSSGKTARTRSVRKSIASCAITLSATCHSAAARRAEGLGRHRRGLGRGRPALRRSDR